MRITKLTKKIEKMDPATGITKIVEDVKMAFDKDVDKYIELGYKDVEVIKEYKDFTSQQEDYYVDGDESAKRTTEIVKPEDRARKSFESEIMNMTIDELQEVVNKYELDIVLGTFETVAAKKKAVLEGIAKAEEDHKKKKAAKAEPAKKADAKLAKKKKEK